MKLGFQTIRCDVQINCLESSAENQSKLQRFYHIYKDMFISKFGNGVIILAFTTIVITKLANCILFIMTQSIQAEELPQIIDMFKDYQTKVASSFISLTTRTPRRQITAEGELAKALVYIEEIESRQREIVKKTLEVLNGLKISIGNGEEKINSESDQINNLQYNNSRLIQQIQELNKEVEQLLNTKDDLQKKLIDSQKKIQELLETKDGDKQSSKERMWEPKQQTNNDDVFQIKNKMKSLEDQNTKLYDHFLVLKNQMQNISAASMQKEARIIQLSQQISTLHNKLGFQKRKLERMEGELEEKKQIINKLIEQSQNNVSSFHRGQDSFIQNIPLQANRISEKYPLTPLKNQFHNDDQLVNQSFRFTHQASHESSASRNTVDVSELEMITLQKPGLSSHLDKNHTSPSFFNPYLAHYVLSCQCIKHQLFEEGNYNCISVKMQEKYSSLQKDKVPLHKWWSWIRQKLKTSSQK